MAGYPWKYQLLLTKEGKLVKTLTAQRFELVKIFPNQPPLLLVLMATAKGNGGHELYKVTGDTLENVYEGYDEYNVKTYDSHQENIVYKPNELILTIKDHNNDGYNDLSFKGDVLFIQGQTENGVWYDNEIINGKTVTYSADHPFKKIPVEFIFLYDHQSGRFKAKENYL